ncbi:MAG: Uma2 family endonuclease [Magnetococcus sp. DMHC-6]
MGDSSPKVLSLVLIFCPQGIMFKGKKMALQKLNTSISEQNYLKGELVSDIKHEYINGELFAMVGAKINHNRLAATINGEFRIHLKGKSCDSLQSDFKVRIGTKYFYPDIVVKCDRDDDHEEYTEHPIVIVEITSESTRKFDRTYKLDVYKTIPSLQEYVIVEQDYVMIDIYKRLADNWHHTKYTLGDSIHFESIGLTLTVEEIYHRVDNEDMLIYLGKNSKISV